MNVLDSISTSHQVAQERTKTRYKVAPKAAPAFKFFESHLAASLPQQRGIFAMIYESSEISTGARGRGFLWIRLRRDMGLAERGTSKPASDCCVNIPPSSHRLKEVRDKVVNRSYGATPQSRLGDRCECRYCGRLFRKRKSASLFFILPTVFISPLSHRLRKFHDSAAYVCAEPPRASGTR